MHKRLWGARGLLVLRSVGVPVIFSAGLFLFLGEILNTSTSVSAEGPVVYNSQTIPLLRAAMHSDPNPAKGGGDLSIVDGSAVVAEAGILGVVSSDEPKPSPDQISVYVVRDGDSLSQIAEMFEVSPDTIIWANDLSKGGLIRPGDTLVILPISGVRHTVSKGDTLQSIAKKYHGDVEEIAEFNNIGSESPLAVGEVILVPDGEITTPKPSPRPSSGAPRVASGFLIRPITGGVRTQGLHGYNAVDLATAAGSQVMAGAAGEVIISRTGGWNAGYGNYVVIRHGNGTQTLYAHLGSVIVGVGQSVVQGQVVGYVGATGKATGPHLHFEVRGASNPF